MEHHSILDVLFLGSAGAMVFAAATLSFFSFIPAYHSHRLKIFAAICLAGSLYQWTTLSYMSSLEISEAQMWLKIQSLIITAFVPLFVAFINLMSHYSGTRRMNTIVTGVYAIIFVLKLSSPDGIRYTHIEGHKSIQLPWGETVHLLHGPSHVFYVILTILFMLSVFWGVWRSALMIQGSKNRVGWIFILINTCFVLSAICGILINKGMIDFFYIEGFNIFLFILLLAVEIFHLAHVERLKLQIAIKDKENIQETLLKISTTIQQKSDENYIEHMAVRVQETLQAQMSQIIILDENQDILQAVSCQHGEILETAHFELSESPYLANIWGEFVEMDGIQRTYPKNTFFVTHQVEAIVSIPLWNEQRKVYGIVAVLDPHPLKGSHLIPLSLKIFASQISSERRVQQALEGLQALAYLDYLTQLFNRAKLHDDLEGVFKRSSSGDYGSTLYHLDIDRFKEINNFLGSEMADQLLIQLAHRFKRLESRYFKPYRLTGDEFIFILEHSGSESNSLDYADKLHQTVSNPFLFGDHQVNVNCSIGLVHFPTQAKVLKDVLKFAETALLEAKASDHIITQVFDPEVQKSLNHREEMEDEMRQALNVGQFELFFQPQIDAQERVFGAEVLLRWKHPQKGFISPSIFIPLAEETGIIHPLGEWILENSIKQAHYWYTHESHVPPHISINVSARQFAQDKFIPQLRLYLNKYPLPTSWITLELTETVIIQDIHATQAKINQLRAMGLSIALDDFGTGYSSLAYIKDLSIDYIKIDKAFVDQIFEEGGFGVVETIISMGKYMDLKIIAEGTETIEQILQLKSFGCKLFQGFFYSQALNVREYESYLSQKMI